MRLLLISNSTNSGEEYLGWPKEHIAEFLGTDIKKVLFFPFAGVTFSYDEYEKRVQDKLGKYGYEINSIHKYSDKRKAIDETDAIMIGGGNTFHLLRAMQQLDIVEYVRKKIIEGIPYVGWSAGSNLTCPTICTTNDMPIVEPDSFAAINLIRFQINPHYLDAHPDGHGGETREQRIEEFLYANPDDYVMGLREGCFLIVEEGKISLNGSKPARIFKFGEKPREIEPGGDVDFLFL